MAVPGGGGGGPPPPKALHEPTNGGEAHREPGRCWRSVQALVPQVYRPAGSCFADRGVRRWRGEHSVRSRASAAYAACFETGGSHL